MFISSSMCSSGSMRYRKVHCGTNAYTMIFTMKRLPRPSHTREYACIYTEQNQRRARAHARKKTMVKNNLIKYYRMDADPRP